MNQLKAVHKQERADPSAAQPVKYLSFSLGAETYALPAASVNEVLRHCEITPVPGSAEAILGIINLRGNVVTVLDARILFDLAQQEAGKHSRIIIVEIRDYAVGIVVDRVMEVADLDCNAIAAPPATGDCAARFIQGVYNRDEQLVILVDFACLDTAD